MKVGVLLVTHPSIGSAMLHVAGQIIGQTTLPVKCLDVPPDSSLDSTFERARTALAELNEGGGVLVLTDIYGATPHNVAHAAARDQPGTAVLSGLNLPMLLRVFNYPEDDLDTLTRKATEGGIRGINSSPPQSLGN